MLRDQDAPGVTWRLRRRTWKRPRWEIVNRERSRETTAMSKLGTDPLGFALSRPGLVQQFAHFFVRGLGEVGVPLTDGVEMVGDEDTNLLIHFALKGGVG